MRAREARLYWEEVEEIVNNLQDKIDELQSVDYVSDSLQDRITAITRLIADLNKL